MKVKISTIFSLLVMSWAGVLSAQTITEITEKYPEGEKMVECSWYKEKTDEGLIKRDSFDLAGNTVKTENFLNGKLHGRSYLYVGEEKQVLRDYYYENGVPVGEQKDFFPDGTVKRKVNFVEGKLHGELLARHTPTRFHFQLNYRKGILHGLQREWRADSTPVYTLNFIAGRLDGLQRWWEPGKEKPAEEHWAQGQFEEIMEEKEGRKVKSRFLEFVLDSKSRFSIKGTRKPIKILEYFETGAMKSLQKLGSEPSTKEFYLNGKLRAEGKGIIGRKEGKWTWYHANGKKKLEGQFKGGQETGKFIGWDEQGRQIEESEWDPNYDCQEPGCKRILWKVTLYHENGEIKASGQLDFKGRKAALWMEYFPNKQIMRKVEYVTACSDKGARPFATTIRKYDVNGKLEAEGDEIRQKHYLRYNDGTTKEMREVFFPNRSKCDLGKWEYYEDGKLYRDRGLDKLLVESKTFYREDESKLRVERYSHEGKLSGSQEGWFQNGRQRYAFQYKDGLPEGSVKEWYEAGQQMLELNYAIVDGKPALKSGIFYREDGKSWEYEEGDKMKSKMEEILTNSHFTTFRKVNE